MMTASLLDFGSDLEARRRYFVRESFAHPAKIHLGALRWIVEQYTQPGQVVGDPMAGIGSILLAAYLNRHVVARELEARWVEIMRLNAAHIQTCAGFLCGAVDIARADARQPWGYQVDHIITSPPYACETRPAGQTSILSHRARRAAAQGWSHRWQTAHNDQVGLYGAMTFRYPDCPGQVGNLRGAPYWSAMRDIYAQGLAALRPRGIMALVIKDHIKDGQRVHVADQTITLCVGLGYDLIDRHKRRVHPLSLWQRRRKERGAPIVEDEDILVFTRRSA